MYYKPFRAILSTSNRLPSAAVEFLALGILSHLAILR